MEKYQISKTVAEPPKPVDLTALYIDFCGKYRNVFMVEIAGHVYIYRALGRGEYRQILEDRRFSSLQKEELICSQCLLYPNPDEYDWDDKEAGIPTELMKAILTDSYLDDVVRRRNLHDFYRAEMYDFENQITCIINEAFPNLDIEEIESWDVEKTTKYLSRAEWKLQNMRGWQFKEAEGESSEYGRNDSAPDEDYKAQTHQAPEENKRKKTLRGGERKDKLTPDKMREREEFMRKHPEFAAMAAKGTVDDVAHMSQQETVDILSPALRTGGNW